MAGKMSRQINKGNYQKARCGRIFVTRCLTTGHLAQLKQLKRLGKDTSSQGKQVCAASQDREDSGKKLESGRHRR